MSSVSLSNREARAKEKDRADRTHDAYVSRTYGIPRGEYERLLQAQDGRCAICTRRPRARRLAVDHDHHTGRVRGLLCYTCNKFVLGFVEFDPIAAHNASVYLADISERLFQWLATSEPLPPEPVAPRQREPDGLPY